MNTTTIEQEAERIDLSVGARIRERRKMKGLSQTQLGDAVGVSFQQVQKYERGRNRVACATLVLIARALECSPMDLLGDDCASAAGIGLDTDVLGDFLAASYGPRLARAFVRLAPDHAKHLASMAEMLAAADETLRRSAA